MVTKRGAAPRGVIFLALIVVVVFILTVYIPRLIQEESFVEQEGKVQGPVVAAATDSNARLDEAPPQSEDSTNSDDRVAVEVDQEAEVKEEAVTDVSDDNEEDNLGHDDDTDFVDDPEDVAEEKKAAAREALDDPDEVEDERNAETQAETDEKQAVSAEVSSETQGPLCIFYDRPPRTGSTTISVALNKCLKTRGYMQPRAGPRADRPLHMQRMIKLKTDRIGLFARHLYIDAKDVAGLRAKCRRLFFATSCKPMKERIWSAAKYRFLPGTSILPETVKQRAIASTLKDKRTEPFLESYPYLSPEQEPLDIEEADKLVPDYVIRAERMSSDLGNLLTALGCPNEFSSKNTHTVRGVSDPILEQLQLKMNDTTYTRLMRYAGENNEGGLKLAATFA